jgi:ABC-type branched-subunit amino acid transport system permease subunit
MAMIDRVAKWSAVVSGLALYGSWTANWAISHTWYLSVDKTGFLSNIQDYVGALCAGVLIISLLILRRNYPKRGVKEAVFFISLISFVATLQIILFDQVDTFKHVINLQTYFPAIVWFNNAELFFVSLVVLLLTRPRNWHLRKASRRD